jgi:hypothetical protein
MAGATQFGIDGMASSSRMANGGGGGKQQQQQTTKRQQQNSSQMKTLKWAANNRTLQKCAWS